MNAEVAAALRRLPSVDQLVRRLDSRDVVRGVPRARLTATAREVLASERQRVRAVSPSGRSSTPPASCSTPIWAARS
jgi:Selenocysteine synthase N terminal